MVKNLDINFLKNYLYIYFLILFFIFSYVSNNFILKLLPEKTITISSLSFFEKDKNYIVILETGETEKFYNLRDIFLENKKLKENTESLKFIKKGEYGYGINAIYTTDSQNKININIKKSPYAKLVFYNVGISKKILLEIEKQKQILDISKNADGEMIEYFPFKKSKIFTFYHIVFFIILGIIVFFITLTLFFILEKIERSFLLE